MTNVRQPPRTSLDELRSFVALGDTGSFVAAGRRLDQDATMISRRLQALERRLGVRLVERTTRRVELTEAGLAYLERVRPLLIDLEHADDEMAAFVGGEPSGHLRVSLPGDFGDAWLGPIIASFLRAHPRVTLSADTTNRYVSMIEERYDVAVRLGTLADSRLVARKIADRRKLLCASPAYLAERGSPNSPGDLRTHSCLYGTGPSDPEVWSFRSGGDRPLDVAVTGALNSSSARLLVQAARAGLGILFTSDWYVGADLASGVLVEVLPEHPIADQGGVYVVTLASQGVPSKTRAFSDWLAVGLRDAPWRSPATQAFQ